MDQAGKPTTPDAGGADTLVRVMMEYNLVTKRLQVLAKSDNIVNEGVLGEALRVVHTLKIDPGVPVAADGVIRVTVDYDLKTEKPTIMAQAPRVLVCGIIHNALGALTRNQIRQGLQIELQALKARLAVLEAKVNPALIGPSGLAVPRG